MLERLLHKRLIVLFEPQALTAQSSFADKQITIELKFIQDKTPRVDHGNVRTNFRTIFFSEEVFLTDTVMFE